MEPEDESLESLTKASINKALGKEKIRQHSMLLDDSPEPERARVRESMGLKPGQLRSVESAPTGKDFRHAVEGEGPWNVQGYHKLGLVVGQSPGRTVERYTQFTDEDRAVNHIMELPPERRQAAIDAWLKTKSLDAVLSIK